MKATLADPELLSDSGQNAEVDMAEVDRLRIARWFQSLDPSVQQAFQRVADEQPALAVKALSNSTVEAPAEGVANLSELFVVSDEDLTRDVAPMYSMWDVPVVQPEHPDPGVAFTVQYTVTNAGSDASAPRRDVVRVFEQDGTTVVVEQPVDGKPLARNESERLSATFAQGVTEGTRYPQILINTDGAPMGAPANEHGNEMYAWARQIDVGVYSAPIGPASAGDTYFTQIREAANELNSASQFSGSVALEPLKTGLTALGTAVVAAAADFSRDQRMGEVAASIQGAAEWVGRIDEQSVRDDWPAELQEAIVALYTAVVPLRTLRYDDETIARYLPPLQERVNTVTQRLFRRR
jgi:hypothetical protein